jgi:hypothetical protein
VHMAMAKQGTAFILPGVANGGHTPKLHGEAEARVLAVCV